MTTRQLVVTSNVLLVLGVALLLTGVFGGVPALVVVGALLELVAIVAAGANRRQRKARGH